MKDSASNLWLLGAAVACLLLIAAANVANLLFCRAAERQRESVIRRTLGATRSTLAGKALLESLILSLLGAGIAWLIALGLIGLMKEVGLQESLARVDGVAFDGATLAFFAGITGLVSLLTGSLSALKAATAGIVVLTFVAFTACLLPAIRAARIDPTAVLRSE